MFVVYPAVISSAAAGLSSALVLAQTLKHSSLQKLTKFIIISGFLASITLSIARTEALTQYYSAPFQIFLDPKLDSTNAGTVCFGKDWYRYPTSFLLPENWNPEFIESDFDGLLPGKFQEITSSRFGLFWDQSLATYRDDFNNQNVAQPLHMVDLISILTL